MEDIRELKSRLTQGLPSAWENMPDIQLYMDQIVSYLSRQLVDYGGDEKMTSAMINNYIKDGLLPRADGKKYSREHIARLTAIAALKQVLPVKSMKPLFDAALADNDTEEFYSDFCKLLGSGMTEAAELIDEAMTDKEIADAAINMAVTAYCHRLVCRKLIDIISQRQSKDPKNRKAK